MESTNARGISGIELETSLTERENHMTRPIALTRDIFLRLNGILLQGAIQELTTDLSQPH